MRPASARVGQRESTGTTTSEQCATLRYYVSGFGEALRARVARLPRFKVTGGMSVGYGVKMSPSWGRSTFAAGSAVLLGGVLGLAWWFWRRRPGPRPVTRFRRVRAVLVTVGLVVIAVGTISRFTFAVRPVSACAPPGGALAAGRSGLPASLLAEKVATWPGTGIGLVYARATDGQLCRSTTADYYVAVHDRYLGGVRAMNMGDVVLTPRFDISRQQLRVLARHEAAHRPQWAIATAIAGPLAFPVAYGVDDFFFPGSRNHFERWAGLESGGYQASGTGPVLGPAQLAVLAALAAAIVAALLAAWRRRVLTRSRARRPSPDT